MRAKRDSYLFRDNPMFVSVMEDKQIAKHVLETVIGRKVADIEYADTEKRHDLGPSGGSIRMDVYLEDREGKAYDVEMQTYAEDDLELRLRRYQSTMDSQTLKPSSRERSLKGSYIIFLCTFDPFGLGLAKYSFERTCQEDRGLVLDTRAHWLVLNAKAWQRAKDPRLGSLLQYIAGEGAADDPLVEEIDERVKMHNEDEKWRSSDMVTLWEKATGEGRAEGRAEGIAEGRAEGIAETEAKFAKREELARALSAKGRIDEYVEALSDEKLMERLLSEEGLS